MGGEQGPVPTSRHRSLPVPRLILDEASLHAAVETISRHPNFVIDVETVGGGARTNELRWVGLRVTGQCFLIPTGHPKGWLIQKEHKEKTAAWLHYPEGDPRRLTKLGKPSWRMVEHTVPSTYGPPPEQLFPDQVTEAIKPLLFSDRGKIGHNVKYDLETVAKYYGGVIPPGPYHDTILIRHTLQEEGISDYGLKALTCAPVYEGGYGIPREKYPELGRLGIDNFGLDEVARYLSKDLHYCWLMFKYWMPRLVKGGVKQVYEFEMSLYPVVMSIEQHGFAVNPLALDKVGEDLRKGLKLCEQTAWKLAGGEFPLSNTNAKRWVLFGHGKKPAFEVAQTGENAGRSTRRPLKSQRLKVLSVTEKERVPQVTQQVLEHYADRNEMARALLEWSMLEKLRGTFVDGINGFLTTPVNGGLPRLHTSLKQHGTVTGRFTSSEPNLQQIPRGSLIRDLFVAGPGNVLLVADYDQIELRCLAYEAREPTMIQIFREDRDIHREAAAAAMQIAIELVTEALRQVGKTLNFATGYGAGPERIAAVAGTSVRRGAQFLRRYYELFSELEPWKRRLLAEARQRGNRANMAKEPPYVEIPPIGRRRRLPELYDVEDWRRWRAERQAVNAVIQGFASYITKLAMLGLDEELPNYPAHMVVQVHDEIVIEVAKPYSDAVSAVVTETMSGVRNAAGKPILGRIPLVVSLKSGYTWAEAKGAK